MSAGFFTQESEIVAPCFEGAADVLNEELLERAESSQWRPIRELWRGKISDYGNATAGLNLALCRILAFWCHGDADRVDRLFRRSGLMRDKWDRRAGESPHGTRTIRAVLPRA